MLVVVAAGDGVELVVGRADEVWEVVVVVVVVGVGWLVDEAGHGRGLLGGGCVAVCRTARGVAECSLGEAVLDASVCIDDCSWCDVMIG